MRVLDDGAAVYTEQATTDGATYCSSSDRAPFSTVRTP